MHFFMTLDPLLRTMQSRTDVRLEMPAVAVAGQATHPHQFVPHQKSWRENVGNECVDHTAAHGASGFVSNRNISARWPRPSCNKANFSTRRSKTAHTCASITRCEVAACFSSCPAVLHCVFHNTVVILYCALAVHKVSRLGKVVVTTASMESGFAVIILLACVLSPHTHRCTRLHPLSPITRSTTFGTKSLGCVFTLPRWQVHRVRLLLKKKGEELVLSCGFAQDLSCSGSDRHAGSSQTPPLPGRPAASPSSGRTRHLCILWE